MKRNIWPSEKCAFDNDTMVSDHSERTDQNRQLGGRAANNCREVFGDGNCNHLRITTDIGVADKVRMEAAETMMTIVAENPSGREGHDCRRRQAMQLGGGRTAVQHIYADIRRRPPITLKIYDGITLIETFLQQFRTCGSYCKLTEDKVVYLPCQLMSDPANEISYRA